jgi:hypothetical protein
MREFFSKRGESNDGFILGFAEKEACLFVQRRKAIVLNLLIRIPNQGRFYPRGTVS